MVTAISQGVKISVETVYQEQYSNPANEHYMFAYSITIENLTSDTVQLLSRKWFIFDAAGDTRIVEGAGVVGLQPVISSGESYSYVSGCTLKSELGSMRGHYTMLDHFTGITFEAEIPEFELIVPYRLN
ncbi:MAG: Co2+/Mg2+ efflux protein ApaG [Pedobacter sp.]|nr:MAG: Co2+/Mg2+ efflux protein ApaG [Pedobacter sp.]